MNSKEDNVSEHIKHLEKLLSILKAKEPKWYEREPFQNTLCWVSNIKNPIEGYTMKVITGYHKGSSYPFCLSNGDVCKYTVPLTKKEILKLILEEQEK